jgi:nitrogen fixation/metabolism regulation signal transduction histidine kinase
VPSSVSSRSASASRRQFFIKKGFQFRFILWFCLLVLFGGMLSTGLILYFTQGNLTSLFSNSRLVVTDTAIYILPAVIYTNMITILIISLSLIVVTLFVSHKIAGPLFRLEQDINVIAKGNLTFTVRLRKGDQLRELPADINEMTASLNTKVAAIQSGVERIMISASDQNAPKWFQDKLHHLHERIGQNFEL